MTGNFFLARETGWIFQEQNLPASLVLTSSANAVVPKRGSEAYDISKTALNHLIRELAVETWPAGSSEWHRAGDSGGGLDYVSAGPRDAVAHEIQDRVFAKSRLRKSCAQAGRFLCTAHIDAQADSSRRIARRRLSGWLSDESAKTTGHMIPVDGGLQEAFLR